MSGVAVGPRGEVEGCQEHSGYGREISTAAALARSAARTFKAGTADARAAIPYPAITQPNQAP